MDLFDEHIRQVLELLQPLQPMPLSQDCAPWPLTDQTPYLMEKDTAVELGGYPCESINLLLCSDTLGYGEQSGVYLLGNPEDLRGRARHISFGKIVLLRTAPVPEDATRDFLEQVQLADFRLHFRDVMTRTSTQAFYTNLRISRQALDHGFSAPSMGRAILEQFLALEQVTQAQVFLVAGDSPLYRQLLPLAESAKRIRIALNTMFEGLELDCGHCDLNAICAQVESLRRMHAAARGKA